MTDWMNNIFLPRLKSWGTWVAVAGAVWIVLLPHPASNQLVQFHPSDIAEDPDGVLFLPHPSVTTASLFESQ